MCPPILGRCFQQGQNGTILLQLKIFVYWYRSRNYSRTVCGAVFFMHKPQVIPQPNTPKPTESSFALIKARQWCIYTIVPMGQSYICREEAICVPYAKLIPPQVKKNYSVMHPKKTPLMTPGIVSNLRSLRPYESMWQDKHGYFKSKGKWNLVWTITHGLVPWRYDCS